MSRDSFAEIWSGVLLRASATPASGEKDLQRNRWRELLNRARAIGTAVIAPGLALLLVVCATGVVGGGAALIGASAVKMAGLMICGVLAWGAMTDDSSFKGLCPAGGVASCHQVTSSPAGKVMGVPLSDLGLIYFGGGFVTLLVSLCLQQPKPALLVLAYLSLLCLPYTLFSIMYQAFAVRAWCWMCLVVQVLIWVECSLSLASGLLRAEYWSWGALVSPALGFSAVALIWFVLRPLLERAHHSQGLEREVRRLRRKPELIEALLAEEQPLVMGRFVHEVELGPRDAGVVITLVVHPLCGACHKAVLQLLKMTETGTGKVGGTVRFLVRSAPENLSEREKRWDYEVSLAVCAAAVAGNHEGVRRSLQAWFASGGRPTQADYNAWRRGVLAEEQQGHWRQPAVQMLENHRSWARELMISATPTAFLNGRKLPRGIEIGDLKYWILRQDESSC